MIKQMAEDKLAATTNFRRSVPEEKGTGRPSLQQPQPPTPAKKMALMDLFEDEPPLVMSACHVTHPDENRFHKRPPGIPGGFTLAERRPAYSTAKTRSDARLNQCIM